MAIAGKFPDKTTERACIRHNEKLTRFLQNKDKTWQNPDKNWAIKKYIFPSINATETSVWHKNTYRRKAGIVTSVEAALAQLL